MLEGIPLLLKGFDASQVAGIGAGGQMHGLVVLDADDNVIRPAILWNDGRTADYAGEQADITADKLGEDHVYFLPYLMGERSPINDTDARGAFVGMTMDTTRAELTQAVLEGVAFAIRDSFEVARSLGFRLSRSMLCGGGAKSPLWKTILANVLDLELNVPVSEQGPGMGGAMLAMVACGEYPDVQSVCKALVSVSETITPQPDLVAKYEARYQKFKLLYPALKSWFKV